MGVAVDRARNVYVADTGNRVIRKISSTGVVSTLAGLAGVAGNADGVGDAARFNAPVGIAVDIIGNVYVVDQFDSTVRKITPDGTVSTLVPDFATEAASNAATVPSAGFNHPNGIAVDCLGNLYIADSGNHTIRKMTPEGVVTVLAGATGLAGASDGQGAGARFNSPFGVAVDLDGNIYVTDQGNSSLRKIAPDGTVTTIAGLPGNPGDADGPGAVARFSFPAGLAIDNAGNLYVADRNNSTIRKVDPFGGVSTLAGVAGKDGSVDGISATALFSFPTALAVDLAGVVYVADTSANTIRMIRTSFAQTPVLRMKIIAGQIRLCWPATATGFMLESRSDFSAGAFWTPVEAKPEVQGCNFVVDLPLQAAAAFFRLRPE
jgi:sugar lactone lactonase YvrE